MTNNNFEKKCKFLALAFFILVFASSVFANYGIYQPEECEDDIPANQVLVTEERQKDSCQTVSDFYCNVESRGSEWRDKLYYEGYIINASKNISGYDSELIPYFDNESGSGYIGGGFCVEVDHPYGSGEDYHCDSWTTWGVGTGEGGNCEVGELTNRTYGENGLTGFLCSGYLEDKNDDLDIIGGGYAECSLHDDGRYHGDSWTFWGAGQSNEGNGNPDDLCVEGTTETFGDYGGPVAFFCRGELITEEGCCPDSWCWNGTGCMNSDIWYNQPHEEPWVIPVNSTCGLRCINGSINRSEGNAADWTYSCLKDNWNQRLSGYCNFNDQCYVGDTAMPYCIGSGDYIKFEGEQPNIHGNHFCLNGSWTTRTVMLGLEMFEFVSGESGRAPERFSLFCDNISMAANLPYNPFTDVEHLCVLQYFEGYNEPSEGNRKVVMGAPLEDTMTVSDIADEFGVSCSSVEEGEQYYECSGSGSKLWYNNGTNSIIYSKRESIGLGEKNWIEYAVDWATNPLGMLNDAFYDMFSERQEFVEFSTYSSLIANHSNVNTYYMAKQNDLEVTAYIDTLYDNKSEELKDFMFLQYTGFENQICVSVNDTLAPIYPYYMLFDGLSTESTKCINVGDGYEVTDVDKDSSMTKLWRHMTSSLRMQYGG